MISNSLLRSVNDIESASSSTELVFNVFTRSCLILPYVRSIIDKDPKDPNLATTIATIDRKSALSEPVAEAVSVSLSFS